MEEYLLHKVVFSEEAIFDYENCLINKKYEIDEEDTDWRIESEFDLPLVILPKQEMKKEIEEFIQTNKSKQHKHYLYMKYFDEQLQIMLMMFIKKGSKQSIIQNWTIIGICEANTWCEEMEIEGMIRNWTKTRITDLPEDDWVEEARIRKEQEEKEMLKDEKEREFYEGLFA